MARLIFRWQVIGREYIPEGSALIAANHLSSLDPPLIGTAVWKNMYYFAKIELFRNRLIGAFLRSVNAFPVRRGEADRKAWRHSLELLRRGCLLLFFPEGTRSRTGELQPPQPGMARLALSARVSIIPAAIIGSNRLRDVFWGRAKLRVGFAQPINIEEFLGDKPNEESVSRLSETVMNEIRRLKDKLECR